MTGRLIISGTRERLSDEDARTVLDVIAPYAARARMIGIGDARGVDALALDQHPRAMWFGADWQGRGSAAGPERNARMVAWCAAEPGGVLLAFPGPRSRGTWDCVRQARAAGLDVVVTRIGGGR